MARTRVNGMESNVKMRPGQRPQDRRERPDQRPDQRPHQRPHQRPSQRPHQPSKQHFSKQPTRLCPHLLRIPSQRPSQHVIHRPRRSSARKGMRTIVFHHAFGTLTIKNASRPSLHLAHRRSRRRGRLRQAVIAAPRAARRTVARSRRQNQSASPRNANGKTMHAIRPRRPNRHRRPSKSARTSNNRTAPLRRAFGTISEVNAMACRQPSCRRQTPSPSGRN